jgi:hypothetical protein
MKSYSYLLSLLLTLSLVACTSTVDRPSVEESLLEMGLELGEGNLRIPSYRINGWRSLDDYNLIITAGVNDRYLVRLRSPCFNLRGAFFIGFTTPTGRLDRFENIIVRGPGRGRETCGIADIVQLQPVGD